MISAMEDEAGIIDMVLRRFGLRIGPAMGKYLLNQIERARTGQADGAVPVIGGDARTGVPQRLLIPTHELLDALQQGQANA
jgi:actin-like ATPase involved in cell morphogenesis